MKETAKEKTNMRKDSRTLIRLKIYVLRLKAQKTVICSLPSGQFTCEVKM